ncbi:MAG: HAD-IIB family hydrolase [Mycoplasmatales bacterium]|nr:HAD-IIB family hydrolase [Mycoplasmatales bacterium]
MKFNPQAYFIDLDGTAFDTRVDGHHAISEKNKKAIIETNKKIPVIISTGRHVKNALPLIQELGLKYAVCQNGAQIVDIKGNIIEKHNFPGPIAERILKIMMNNKMMIKPNDDGIFYGAKFPYGIIARHVGFKTHKKYDFEHTKEFTKLVFSGARKNKIAKLNAELSEQFPSLSIVTSGNGYTIEVTSGKATKGQANVTVAKLLGLKPKEAAHIGDSMNDSTCKGKMMLVAMANSNPKLIKMADWLAPSYKPAGLSKILLNKEVVMNK